MMYEVFLSLATLLLLFCRPSLNLQYGSLKPVRTQIFNRIPHSNHTHHCRPWQVNHCPSVGGWSGYCSIPEWIVELYSLAALAEEETVCYYKYTLGADCVTINRKSVAGNIIMLRLSHCLIAGLTAKEGIYFVVII